MIQTRRAQRTFGDGLIAEEIKDLHEEWMKHADQVLGDKEIVAAIYEALAKRHPQSRTRGRPGTPAEVVLRLLVLKHMRNWSYGVLEREVRANLVYRDFTRVGGTKMPDAKTMGRWGVAVGPVVVKQIHERIVQIARDHRVAQGPADARRHHGGRDQHSLPHRQQPVGRRGAGADPHDEEDHRDRWGGRHPTARSQPQRQMAGVGDRAGGPRQRSTKRREAGAGLPQITGGNRPGGGTGKTLRHGDRRRRQAGG